MSPDPNREPYTGFRNPLLYTSFLLAIAALYVGWVFFSRRQDRREFEEKAAAKKREEDRRAVEMMGGNRFEILSLEPQNNPVWPSLARCVDVAPKKDTTYTLTIEDGKGNTKTATLTVQVR